MKIGILTFFNAHNYGAVLQAYALKTYCEKLGYQVKIINYRNKHIDAAYPRKLRPRIGKKDFFCPWKWNNIILEIDRMIFSRKSWKSQWNKFEIFIEEKLGVTKGADWKEEVKECDFLIFGSDQIWERNIVGRKEKVLFGELDSKAKKISYAASCYGIDSKLDSLLIKQLDSFIAVSVRESHLAKAIATVKNNIVPVEVVDPVFLPNPQVYRDMTHFVPNEKKYKLFYYVSECSELDRISRYLTEQNELVIEIHYYNTHKIHYKNQLSDVGPYEFVGYLLYADTIYTNSFHGVAFSIILHKQFWALNTNIRLINLLNNLGISDRNVIGFDDWLKKSNELLDFSISDSKLIDLVKRSKNFLNENLKVEY